MCSSPSPSARRSGGSRASAPQRRSLRIAPYSASRLLRCGLSTSCRECGNPVECYLGADDRLVRLHPHELPVAGVPESYRWHVSRGIAHPAGDGSSWCRLTHDLLCPARPAPTAAPQLSGLRRALALRTPRLLDTEVLAPPATGRRPAARARPSAVRPGPSCSCCSSATWPPAPSMRSSASPRPGAEPTVWPRSSAPAGCTGCGPWYP
ncbi:MULTISPECIES: DUF6083 domain-containing protein [Streptomyces]|uniref:DUF6083 domain-containing protein n=1 Tax=Streptomyces TaxID=1883 RepID=UPI001F4FEAD9|nr:MULTISPECIES: DUF6083 domain-containing protein [Streptomyces]